MALLSHIFRKQFISEETIERFKGGRFSQAAAPGSFYCGSIDCTKSSHDHHHDNHPDHHHHHQTLIIIIIGPASLLFPSWNSNDCTNPSLSRSQAAVAPLCPPGCHYRKVHLAFEQLLHVEQLEHLQRHGHLEHLHCFCTLSILSTLVWLRSCPRVITCQSVRKADTGQYSLQQQEWFKQGWLKLDITSVYDPLLYQSFEKCLIYATKDICR